MTLEEDAKGNIGHKPDRLPDSDHSSILQCKPQPYSPPETTQPPRSIHHVPTARLSWILEVAIIVLAWLATATILNFNQAKGKPWSFSASIRKRLTTSRVVSPTNHRHSLAGPSPPDALPSTKPQVPRQMDAPRRTLYILHRRPLPSGTKSPILGGLRVSCNGRRRLDGALGREIGNDECIYTRGVS